MGKKESEGKPEETIKIELDYDDTKVSTVRHNVVNQLIRGIMDMVDTIPKDLEDHGFKTVDTDEIGSAFASVLYNITEHIIIDFVKKAGGDATIVDAIEEGGGGRISPSGKTGVS